MKNKIYLVEQIWSDSMENKVEKALGYEIIGYVVGEEGKECYESLGRDYDVNDCWALKGTLPEYRLTELKRQLCLTD